MRMTPARVASAAVLAVLTLVCLLLMLDTWSFMGALLVSLIGAVLFVAGAWFAPLARSGDALGGTPLRPWQAGFDGPKTTQVAGGGLVALLVALVTGGAPLVGPILGVVAAVIGGRFLRIPSHAQVVAAVGPEVAEASEHLPGEHHDAAPADSVADPDTDPVPVPATEAADSEKPRHEHAADVSPETAPVPVIHPADAEHPHGSHAAMAHPDPVDDVPGDGEPTAR